MKKYFLIISYCLIIIALFLSANIFQNVNSDSYKKPYLTNLASANQNNEELNSHKEQTDKSTNNPDTYEESFGSDSEKEVDSKGVFSSIFGSIKSLINKGGFLMIPIFICSILALGIFIERLYSLRKEMISPQSLILRIEVMLKQGRQSEALGVCRENKTPMANVLFEAVKHSHRALSDIKEAVSDRGKRESKKLRQFIGIIGTVASISPLLGLLGTVTGMIKVFQKITTEGIGDPRILASGIWEALITTAAGLSVAIVAFVAYHFLLSRSDSLILEMEENAMQILEVISTENENSKEE